MMESFDQTGISLATIFLVIGIVVVYQIFDAQYRSITYQTIVIQILSTRASLFPLIYSFLLYISFMAPSSFGAMQIITAAAEGYSLLCVFALITENFGSPEACVAQLRRNNRNSFCWCFCYSSDMGTFYWTVHRAMLHLVFTRTAIVLAAAVTSYLGFASISVILTSFAFVLIVYGFFSLISFYQLLWSQCENLGATTKLVILKMSVGLMVFEELLLQILVTLGVLHIPHSRNYNSEDSAIRVFCVLILGEYAIMSPIVYWAFAAKMSAYWSDQRLISLDAETQANLLAESLYLPHWDTSSGSLSQAETSASSSSGGAGPFTRFHFLMKILQFTDLAVLLQSRVQMEQRQSSADYFKVPHPSQESVVE